MNSVGELNHSDEGKSKLIDILAKHVSHSKIPASAYIKTMEAIQVVKKMSNPPSMKTFKYLADMFCQDVEELIGSCRVVVIEFSTYYDIELNTVWAS